jgi:hypothetical protein
MPYVHGIFEMPNKNVSYCGKLSPGIVTNLYGAENPKDEGLQNYKSR